MIGDVEGTDTCVQTSTLLGHTVWHST